MGDKENKTPCGHKGKWTGCGQNVVKTEDAIVIISTSICGECGQPVISVNKMEITKNDVIPHTSDKIQTPPGKKIITN